MASRTPFGESKGWLLCGPGEGSGADSIDEPDSSEPINTTCPFSQSTPTSLPSGSESTIAVSGEILSSLPVIDGPYRMSGRLGENPNPPTQVPIGGLQRPRELPGEGTVVVV